MRYAVKQMFTDNDDVNALLLFNLLLPRIARDCVGLNLALLYLFTLKYT